MIIENSSAGAKPALASGTILPGQPDSPKISPLKNDSHAKHFSTDHLLTNLKGRTISSGVVTTIAQGIWFVLNLGSTLVLARLLPRSDFGLVAMVMTVMGFLRVFKDAGLSTATVQREGITHEQVSNLFWINVAMSGGITLLIAAGSPLIAWFYHDPRLIPISLVLSSTFLLTGLTVQHNALLNRQMRFKLAAAIQVGSMALGVVVGITMALRNYGYWSLVGSNLTTALATFLFTWFAVPWRPKLPTRGCGTRSLFNFGIKLSLGNFIYSVAGGSDGLLVGRVYGADALGLYSRASALLMTPLQHFINPIYTVFVPVLSRLQDQTDRYRRTFLQLYNAVALISFLVTGLFFALAYPLTIAALGHKWEEAAPIFAGFTFAALAYPLSSASSWLFVSQGRGKDWLVITSVGSAINVLSFVCGLPWGPVGVSIAFSIASVLVQLPVVYYIAGRRGAVTTKDLWLVFLRHVPVWLVVCGATWLMRSAVSTYAPLLQLLICGPVGLIAGGIFIALFPPTRKTALSLFEIVRKFKRPA